ncbi:MULTISPECIES: hypothetical protein [unclassified Nostoc]|nr:MULTISPECIES: hypothetical protein [unclassified Nostoc]
MLPFSSENLDQKSDRSFPTKTKVRSLFMFMSGQTSRLPKI